MDINVKSRQARKDYVNNAVTVRDHREEFDGAMQMLPIKKIPVEYLVYRMNNMRTTVEQLEFVTQNELDADFFKANQESDVAQTAQHQILIEMSKSNIANIWEALRERRVLRDPLVVTPDCVVVNGNRRLAAIRDLINSSPQEFSSFLSLECIILPESDESTLVDYETRIQIARDLRSDYGWVHTALGLQTQIYDLGWSQERAVQAWGKEWKELTSLLESFALAREFLEFLDKPGDYANLSDKEQVFKTLAETQSKEKRDGKDPSTLYAQRLIVFQVLKSEDFEGRAFDYARMAPELLKKIKTNPIVNPPSSEPSGGMVGENDPFSGLPAPEGGDQLDGLIEELQDVSKTEEIRDLAEAAKTEIALEKSAQRRQSFLSTNTRAAHNSLSTIISIEDAPTDSLSTSLSHLLDTAKEVERLVNLILVRDPNSITHIEQGRMAAVELRVQSLLKLLDSTQR